MEPELIGSWVQTNAYLLNEIKQLIEKYSGTTINVSVEPTPVDIVINPTPITVNPTPVTTEVILQQNITLPRQTEFIHNPLPIITPAPNTNFRVVTNYITPAPLVIDIDKMNAYQRVCGAYNPIGNGYVQCMNCVDSWLAARPDGFLIKDLTRTGTGCTTKIPKRCCKPNGMPF